MPDRSILWSAQQASYKIQHPKVSAAGMLPGTWSAELFCSANRLQSTVSSGQLSRPVAKRTLPKSCLCQLWPALVCFPLIR